MVAPRAARSRASAFPSPSVAPVTRIVCWPMGCTTPSYRNPFINAASSLALCFFGTADLGREWVASRQQREGDRHPEQVRAENANPGELSETEMRQQHGQHREGQLYDQESERHRDHETRHSGSAVDRRHDHDAVQDVEEVV